MSFEVILIQYCISYYQIIRTTMNIDFFLNHEISVNHTNEPILWSSVRGDFQT